MILALGLALGLFAVGALPDRAVAHPHLGAIVLRHRATIVGLGAAALGFAMVALILR